MEIAYPDPTKEKKDLSPTDFTSDPSHHGNLIREPARRGFVCSRCPLQETSRSKGGEEDTKGKKQTSSPSFAKNGQYPPPMTAAEPPEVLSQDKINEYAKIREQ
ncbi:hypothetical protein KI387_033442, partial [Taxus chinensis]